MKNKNWENNSLFLEFRFSPSPEFFNKKQELFTNLYKYFPNYNPQNFDSILMHTTDTPGLSLSLFPGRFLLASEIPNEEEEFIESALKSWKIISEILKIKTLVRFGIRLNTINKMVLNLANEKMVPLICVDSVNSELQIQSANISIDLLYKGNKIKAVFNAGNSQTIILSPIQQNGYLPGVTTQSIQTGIIADIDFSNINVPLSDIKELFSMSNIGISECLSMIE